MVLPGERDYMVTGPERSKTLHNFTLPWLKWGNQRHLRCMKVESASGSGGGGGGFGAGHHRLRRRSSPLKIENSSEMISARFSADADHRSNNQLKRLRTPPARSDEDGGGEEGIDEFREKMMSDLRTVADKMKELIFKKEVLGDKDEGDQTDGGDNQEKERRRAKQKEAEKHKEMEVSPTATETAPAAEVMPWNLRTRRAACKAPSTGAGNYNGSQRESSNHSNKGMKIGERRVDSSPLRNDSAKSLRTRDTGGAAGGETKERRRFSVSLTRKEIEDDFMELLGHRPPRRPKKRPRTVQKQLDFLFPGLYLTEITADTYKVPESAENGKR